MSDYPILTDEQKKRFCDLLVSERHCSSLTQARKLLKTPRLCKETFLKFVNIFDDHSSIDDVCLLYVADDVVFPDSDGSVAVDVKTKRTGRGKSSRPSKKVTSIAFDPDVYQELEQLAISEERTVGSLVRLAVNFFLESRKKAV